MSWTLCTSGAAVARAGAYVNTDVSTSGALLTDFSDQAEGEICAECHTDFVTNYADFDTEIQNALQSIAVAKIARRMVAYDISNYTGNREAETILDVLDDDSNKGLQTLKDKKKQRLSG